MDDLAARSTPTADAPGRLTRAAWAAARVSKQVELALADLDLSLPQYRALAFLARGTLTPSVLAGRLAVTRPTITALVDGLVQRGWVARQAHPDDGRCTIHQLTPQGEAMLARADEAVAAWLDGLLGHLPAPDRERAIDGLLLCDAAIDRTRTAEEAR